MKDAKAFFEALYGDMQDGEFIEIRCGSARTRQMFFKSPEAAARASMGLAGEGDVYYGVALRDGKGGKKSNIVRIPALWADLDNKPGLPPIPERLARTKTLMPSAIVASGGGLHLYWFLEESVRPESIPVVEDLNKRIARWVGGDTVHDAPRILRVPDTFNYKYPEPAKVRCYLLEPKRRYTSEQMFAVLGDGCGVSGKSLSCRTRLWEGVAKGGRNNACFHLAVDLKREGTNEEEAQKLLSIWNTSNRPPLEYNQLENTVRSAYSGDYAGLGCEKQSMIDLCDPQCVVLKKQSVPSPPSPALWRLSELMEREIPPVEFVLDPLVPKMGVTLVTGEGGIGKSFILIEMAKSVAAGRPFLEKFDCAKGPVLMVDLENHDTVIAKRAKKLFAAWEDTEHMYGNIPIYGIQKGELEDAGLYIDTQKGMETLLSALERTKPVMLTIDPLVAVHSKDENDNVAMRGVIRKLQELARRYEMAVVVVHHPRKRGLINDAGQMIRGASDLRNAVDSHLYMRKAEKNRIALEQDKNRHAPEMDAFMIEMTDINDGSATVFRYAGEVTEAQEKSAEARECILDLLRETGPCKRKELMGRLKAVGLSTVTLDRVFAMLVEEGVVCRPAYGVYALSDEETQLDI